MTILPPTTGATPEAFAPPPPAVPAAPPRPAPAAPSPAPAAPSPAPGEPRPAMEVGRDAAALQATLDRFLQDSRTSLRFRVDAEADRVIVTVVDADGQPILQVPSETALRIARSLAATGRGLLDDEA